MLSHRSAGQAWQLLRTWRGAIEVTRASGWRASAGILVHRGPLPGDEIAVIDGIPVTGVSRTLLDLAAVVSRERLERALNEAEVLGLTDRVSVPVLLERYPRRPGSAVLRALFRDETAVRGVTRSRLERRFVRLIKDHRLPRPRFNADVAVSGRSFCVDCLWAEAKLIVELDGREAHGTPQAFESDRERDRLLLVDGWQVMRVTWKQLRDEPGDLAADLRRVLGTGPVGAAGGIAG